MAPRSCQIADDATATSLMDQWAEAIKTEHPDRITRLFAPDASMEGFASPVTRTTYATIREYYLYYFQFARKSASRSNNWSWAATTLSAREIIRGC